MSAGTRWPMEKEQEFDEEPRLGVAVASASNMDTWERRNYSGASGRALPQSRCRRSFA